MSDMANSASNLSMVQGFYAAPAETCAAGLGHMLHPDFIAWEASSLPYAGRYEGEAGLLQLLADLSETWSQIDASEFAYVASGDNVVASFRLRATSRATGNAIDQRVCEFWTFRAGKAAFLQVFYFDAHLVREACGIP